MAKIFYGINGEGMGHAIRSKPILEHLSKKHDVRVFAGGKAYKFFKGKYDLHHLQYYHFIYLRNRANHFLSLLLGFLHTPFMSLYNSKIAYYILKDRPDIAISDFEGSITYWANIFRIPTISIDNQHALIGTNIEVEKRHKWFFNFTKRAVKFFAPRVDMYIATTFFFNKITTKNLFFVPPILRDDIRALRTKYGSHVLVYQTSQSNIELLPALKGIDEKFVVYGLGERPTEVNIRFKQIDEKNFYRDFASCKAVITNGGFTLISEAIYLGKPIFCNVIGNQFEQIINGYYVEKLGYGISGEKIGMGDLAAFLQNLESYRKNLRKFKREDNSKLFGLIDGFIESSKG